MFVELTADRGNSRVLLSSWLGAAHSTRGGDAEPATYRRHDGPGSALTVAWQAASTASSRTAVLATCACAFTTPTGAYR